MAMANGTERNDDSVPKKQISVYVHGHHDPLNFNENDVPNAATVSSAASTTFSFSVTRCRFFFAFYFFFFFCYIKPNFAENSIVRMEQ